MSKFGTSSTNVSILEDHVGSPPEAMAFNKYKDQYKTSGSHISDKIFNANPLFYG